MDEKQAAFEQLALRQFKIWSSTASKTLNNYSIIMINNSGNKKKSYDCCAVFSVANLWVNLTGFYNEFHIIIKHCQNLKSLVLKEHD